MRKLKILGRKISKDIMNSSSLYFPHFIQYNDRSLKIFPCGSLREYQINHVNPYIEVVNIYGLLEIDSPKMSLAEAAKHTKFLDAFLKDTSSTVLDTIEDLAQYLIEQGFAKCTPMYAGIHCKSLHKDKTRYFVYKLGESLIFTHLWVDNESDIIDWLQKEKLNPDDFHWNVNMDK